jgi:hypothetical protein
VGSYVCVYILVFCIFITFYFRSLVSCKHRNPQSTRHKRSKIKGDKDTKYKNINTHIENPQYTRSPFILDLLCLVDCGFLGFCLYSCILYLYHLLFFIPGVLWTVGSSVLCLKR